MAHGVAGLAICETLGSLLAPLILRGLQARWPGVEVFFVGAGIIGVAGGFFMVALGVGWWEGKAERSKGGAERYINFT